ncbi:DsrE family protein [Lacimicrobium sp. SS2-24]|uniref:DsrE family protein n=1 Tax=Lacimicrobium sp. SS2-24 TaxID=2005569 RepID=UPI000B4C16EB|nr:DsrE family protein [Lacimicrobium sp. SS2-24]
MLKTSAVLITFLFPVFSVLAQDFNTGPLIKDFGAHAAVEPGSSLNSATSLNVSFDLAKKADSGKVNRSMNSLARFLNMHVANGVPAENIRLAMVVHGDALFDLLGNDSYQAKYGQSNANIPLIQALLQNQVRIIVCGQSAAYHKVAQSDLLPGVEVALSAMTAHALLQQQGYTLNPF